MSAEESVLVGRPGSVLNASALVFGVATLGLVGPGSTLALAGTAVGVVALVVGVTIQERRTVALGSFLLLAAVLAAGAYGAPAARFLPAVATALLAWDCTNGAVSIREELRGGTSARAELLHAATASVAGGLGVAIAYLAYRLLSFAPSVVGVALLVVAAIVLGFALRE